MVLKHRPRLMPEITITISIPDGAAIDIGGLGGLTVASEGSQSASSDDVERYWREYVSENGRRVFGQAARHQEVEGPGFTLEDLARDLSIDYESVKSFHRSTGRAAKRWRRETGRREPIELEAVDYDWDTDQQGWRTAYRLREGVAREIRELRAGD